MAVRDMDTAAAVHRHPHPAHQAARVRGSARSTAGWPGALWAFAYLGTVEPHGFDLSRSFQVLFIIIIGGLGSIAGAFLGAAFIVLLPIAADNVLAARFFAGVIDPGHLENLQKLLFGALIVLFLVEAAARAWPASVRAGPRARCTARPPRPTRQQQRGTAMTMHVPSTVIALEPSLARSALPAGAASPARAGSEQYFPLQSYRVGPYAAGGTGFFGGLHRLPAARQRPRRRHQRRQAHLVRVRDRIRRRARRRVLRAPEEGPRTARPTAATNPLSVGIAYATIDRQTTDKIPLVTINHGRTDSTDGSVFPYIFPLQLNPYSEIAAIITYIGQQAGGEAKLEGKKIVTLYHGSPYGKETIPILDLYAKKHGFEITHLEVPHPGNEQQSQWLNIRRDQARLGDPARLGRDEPGGDQDRGQDRLPGGPHHRQHLEQRRGGRAPRPVPWARATSRSPPTPRAPTSRCSQDIEKHVVAPGKGNLAGPEALRHRSTTTSASSTAS